MTDNTTPTYNFICFTDLAYEFDVAEKKEIERKIRRRLKYYKLGDYDQDRVDYIRQLKNDLHSEISKGTKSRYFKKSKSKFSDLADFSIDRMVADYKKKYGKIEKSEIMNMINFAIYLYYMR